MSSKQKIVVASLGVILTGFLSLPIVGAIGAIGLLGYNCTPVVTVTSTPGATTLSISAAYFNQYSAQDQATKKAIAALIITIGKERKLTDRSIEIAIGTAIQESNLTNLPYLGANNDHNSRGIFQQQPSPEWGTAEQIQDPIHAIKAFYGALEKITDRDTRPMMDVAIQVQIPDITAYKKNWKWDAISTEIVAQNANSSTQQCATRNVSGTWQDPLNPKTYTISSDFGERLDPVSFVWKLHDGIDLAAPGGASVYAASDGIIASAGWYGGYGNFISITHPGSIVTGYGHLSAFAAGIHQGQQVAAGQLIGYVGSTGESTGNHLHFQVHVDGKPVDPAGLMSSVGVSLRDNAKG
jgi:murein DD-endopeptidase MepM/ murein hydrolase activator NlpD